MLRQMMLLLLGALVLTACGGGANQKSISEGCQRETGLSLDMCDCMAKKAVNELDEEGLELLQAMLDGDDARMRELRRELSMQDAARVATLMTRAPALCADETSED